MLTQVSPDVVDAAGSSLIKDTALGAFAIICLTLAVWAIRTLKQVQDDRVTDNAQAAGRLEAANEKDRATQAEGTKAIQALASAVAEQARGVERLASAVAENTRALETIIRDALRSRGTGASGGYPNPRGPAR